MATFVPGGLQQVAPGFYQQVQRLARTHTSKRATRAAAQGRGHAPRLRAMGLRREARSQCGRGSQRARRARVSAYVREHACALRMDELRLCAHAPPLEMTEYHSRSTISALQSLRVPLSTWTGRAWPPEPAARPLPPCAACGPCSGRRTQRRRYSRSARIATAPASTSTSTATYVAATRRSPPPATRVHALQPRRVPPPPLRPLRAVDARAPQLCARRRLANARDAWQLSK
jgi:hypothetical protein